MDRGPEQTFFQEDTKVANRHMKRFSTSLSGKRKSKPQRYHLVPLRMAVSKRQEMTNFGENVEKRGPSCIAGRTVNYRKLYGSSSKT